MTDYDDPRAYGEQPRLTDADILNAVRIVQWGTKAEAPATPPPPADVVPVPREVLAALLDTVKVVAAGPLDEAGFCICCYRSMFGRNGAAQPNNHTDECPVRLARAQRDTLDALLARDEPRNTPPTSTGPGGREGIGNANK